MYGFASLNLTKCFMADIRNRKRRLLGISLAGNFAFETRESIKYHFISFLIGFWKRNAFFQFSKVQFD